VARQTIKNLQAAYRAPFTNRFGVPSAGFPIDRDFDNGYSVNYSNAADTESLPMIGSDSDNIIQVGASAYAPQRLPIEFNLGAIAAPTTQTFFIAPIPMTIRVITLDYSVASGNSGDTIQIYHDVAGQSAGGGTALLTTAFTPNSTANTVQTGALLSLDGNGNPNAALTLAAGDRLSMAFAGSGTALVNCQITVWVRPGLKGTAAVYQVNANSAIATQSFFLANRDCQVLGVQMFWGTAGVAGGTVTLDVTHDTSTNAPGAGTSILSAAQNAKLAANTVYTQTLTATVAQLKLLAGDRLSLKTTGTLTSLANVCIVVWLTSISPSGYYGQMEAVYTLNANGSIATEPFFTAERDLIVRDVSLVFGTAGSGTVDVQIDKGTTAPGSGTSVLTSTMAATGSANTVVVGVLSVSRRKLLLSQGDRLTFVPGGTLGTLAGVTVAVSLQGA
jgi:hypothetical protein